MGRWEDLESDKLMSTLMGLFEKKLAWSMQNQDRVQSLAEKAEQNKTDLEYARLNQLIKSDTDKQAFEERKMVTGYKNGLDLETMKQKGLMDVAVLNNASDMTKAKWIKEASIYGHDAAATGEALKASHSVVKEADGTTTSKFDPRAYDAIQAKLKAGGGSASQIQNSINVTRDYLTAKDPKSAAAYMGSLPQNTQDAVRGVLGVTTPAPSTVISPSPVIPKPVSVAPKPSQAVASQPVATINPETTPVVLAETPATPASVTAILSPEQQAIEDNKKRWGIV